MLDVGAMYRELDEKLSDWADKKAAYQALEDVTKTVLAQCKLRQTGTIDYIDSQARTDPQYTAHLESLRRARAAFLTADAARTVVLALVDMRRTEASMERAMLERGVLSGD